MQYSGESGYINLIKRVLEQGVQQTDRTGVGCISVFDANLIYPEGEFGTLSTVRPAGLRLAFEEMWMFLRGETNTETLEEKGIFFWKGNTSREFLDKRGLHRLPEGDLGSAYSKQWRNIDALREQSDSESEQNWRRDEVDQLSNLLDTLKKDKYSRRMVVSLWNPAEEHMMPLTPCWWSCQVVVLANKDGTDTLHMKLNNRSLDIVFGCPFAVQQYRLFQLALCQMFGFKMGSLSCNLSHVHIYNNQIEYAQELVQRELGTHGRVQINKRLNCLDDLLGLRWEDIEVTGLEVNKTPFKAKRPGMAV